MALPHWQSRVRLQFVIVVFPDHTHLLFLVLFSGLSFNGGLCDDSAKTAIVTFRHDSTLASYAAQMLGRR